MNILLISGTYPPDKCGVGDYTFKLYDSLLKAKANHDIYLLNSQEILKNGERLTLFPQPLQWSFFGIWQILEEIKSINPDIINLQFPTLTYRLSVSVLFLVMRLKQLGFRIITTLHEYSFSPKLAQLRTNIVIKASHQLIVVDEQYKKDIVDRGLCDGENISFIPIGSNIDPSKLDVKGIQLLRSQYMPDNGKLIGYFGFIFPAKGIESLIKLGQMLKRQNRIFKIMIIADLNTKTRYHQKILKMISESGLDQDLIVTGYLPASKIADLLKSMDVVVFPFTQGISTKNGSVLAALNQGVNVISTRSNRVQSSPFKLLHLVEHYTDIAQMVNIIDNDLIYNVDNEILDWEEIGERTISFLTSGFKLKTSPNQAL